MLLVQVLRSTEALVAPELLERGPHVGRVQRREQREVVLVHIRLCRKSKPDVRGRGDTQRLPECEVLRGVGLARRWYARRSHGLLDLRAQAQEARSKGGLNTDDIEIHTASMLKGCTTRQSDRASGSPRNPQVSLRKACSSCVCGGVGNRHGRSPCQCSLFAKRLLGDPASATKGPQPGPSGKVTPRP
jgi:hypothetical protein